MRERAYNAPPADYQHPVYSYIVVMTRDGVEERSHPLSPGETDGYIGWKHRGGWTYVSTEQVPGA